MIHPTGSIDGTVRLARIRAGRGIAPVRATAPAAAARDAHNGEERRDGSDRRRRGIPVLLDTRCGERRGRFHPVRC
jgi:hypothetical protein